LFGQQKNYFSGLKNPLIQQPRYAAQGALFEEEEYILANLGIQADEELAKQLGQMKVIVQGTQGRLPARWKDD